MLRIQVGRNIYTLQYGTYTIGGTKYVVDCRGIVKQTNFCTTNIYTDNSVVGRDDGEKILNQIEVDGLARGVGIVG